MLIRLRMKDDDCNSFCTISSKGWEIACCRRSVWSLHAWPRKGDFWRNHSSWSSNDHIHPNAYHLNDHDDQEVEENRIRPSQQLERVEYTQLLPPDLEVDGKVHKVMTMTMTMIMIVMMVAMMMVQLDWVAKMWIGRFTTRLFWLRMTRRFTWPSPAPDSSSVMAFLRWKINQKLTFGWKRW